jgi:hypothetical protein
MPIRQIRTYPFWRLIAPFFRASSCSRMILHLPGRGVTISVVVMLHKDLHGWSRFAPRRIYERTTK